MSDGQILQLLGIAYFATGLGALLNPKFYNCMLDKYIDNSPIIYINSFIILTIGYLLVTFHNRWEYDWPVIITIVGWIALAKGLFMLLLPQSYISIAKKMRKSSWQLSIQALLVAIIGSLFIYLGYFVL